LYRHEMCLKQAIDARVILYHILVYKTNESHNKKNVPVLKT